MKQKRLLISLLLSVLFTAGFFQAGRLFRSYAGAPSGSCGSAHYAMNESNGLLYLCSGSSWVLASASFPIRLNSQFNLSPVTGSNGSDVNIVSYSLPGGTASAANSRIEISWMFKHTTGTASTDFKFFLGSCSSTMYTSQTGINAVAGKSVISVTNSSSEYVVHYKSTTTAASATNSGTNSPTTCSMDMTQPQTIAISALESTNNTEQYTVFDFQVTQVQ